MIWNAIDLISRLAIELVTATAAKTSFQSEITVELSTGNAAGSITKSIAESMTRFAAGSIARSAAESIIGSTGEPTKTESAV